MAQQLAEPQFDRSRLEIPREDSDKLLLLSYSHAPLPILPLARHKNRKAVRSQVAIEAAILNACRTPTVQHWIMVKARLGYDTFWKHMNKLLSMGVMDETIEGSRTLYRVNARGLEMLSQLPSSD